MVPLTPCKLTRVNRVLIKRNHRSVSALLQRLRFMEPLNPFYIESSASRTLEINTCHYHVTTALPLQLCLNPCYASLAQTSYPACYHQRASGRGRDLSSLSISVALPKSISYEHLMVNERLTELGEETPTYIICPGYPGRVQPLLHPALVTAVEVP